MRPAKRNSRDIAGLLDSDDELPDSYEEAAVTPAYLNDNRFNHIELPWLNHCSPVRITQKNAEQKLDQKNFETYTIPADIGHAKDENKVGRSKIIISKGVLTKHDLFFVKSIEEHCTESTLLWFIKSLQSKSTKYTPHRSCLAMDYCPDDYNTHNLESFKSPKGNSKYYLKVKYL